MELKKISGDATSLELHVDGEDVAVAEIVHRELLKDPRVVFAGVAPLHPLLRRLVVKVQTKQVAPVQALVEGSEQAQKNVAAFLDEVKKLVSLQPEAKEE